MFFLIVQTRIYFIKLVWKNDFVKNLAKYMPNVYLHKVTTSCGTLDAIKYDSNYSDFVKEWDFRKLARVN